MGDAVLHPRSGATDVAHRLGEIFGLLVHPGPTPARRP